MRKQAYWMKVAFAACTVLLAAGCSAPMANYQSALPNLEALRAYPGKKLEVGEFTSDPKKPGINSVSARASTLTSPYGGSFSEYLKQGAKTELEAAGRYDAKSDLRLEGMLLENDLSAAGISTASATISARFVVKNRSQSVYDKVIKQESQWESSFIGAIAIPAAVREYTASFAKLLNKLFTDEDFRKATSQ